MNARFINHLTFSSEILSPRGYIFLDNFLSLLVMKEARKGKESYGSNTIKLHWGNHSSEEPSGTVYTQCENKVSSVL